MKEGERCPTGCAFLSWDKEGLERCAIGASRAGMAHGARYVGGACPTYGTKHTGVERPEKLVLSVHQQDWVPGFANLIVGSHWRKSAHLMIGLNVGALMAAVAEKDIGAADAPYHIAASIMHEVIHVLELWAGVEFSEERVEALIEKYRKAMADSMEGGS